MLMEFPFLFGVQFRKEWPPGNGSKKGASECIDIAGLIASAGSVRAFRRAIIECTLPAIDFFIGDVEIWIRKRVDAQLDLTALVDPDGARRDRIVNKIFLMKPLEPVGGLGHE